MWIRTETRLFETTKIFVRTCADSIEICATLQNTPDTPYPIIKCKTRDAAINILTRLQEAITLNYPVFDVRLHTQTNEQEPENLYETTS